MLGGRNAIPNVCILPLESRSNTTWRRHARLGGGVRLHAGINRVLNRLGSIVPSRSSVVGVQQWSQRWVSGIMGVDWAVARVSEQM
jgi:hypothetical protein